VLSSAPRISPRLLKALERIDDGELTIAEIRRRVGAEADRLGLPRPSYERVRELVHESRRLRARVTTGDVLLGIAFRSRPPDAFLDHISGVGVPRLP
jgi:class 3 adenylate cyclase